MGKNYIKIDGVRIEEGERTEEESERERSKEER